MARELEFLLVRHLPTCWNAVGRLQGRRDIGVAAGASYTSEVLREIREFNHDVAWSSQLRRTSESAALAGVSDIHRCGLLDELDFGEFEGSTNAVLIERTSGKWLSSPFSTPLGPALNEMRRRIIDFRIGCAAVGSRHLVFGHGAWIRLAVTLAGGLPPNHMNRIQYPPGSAIQANLPSG